MCGDHLSVPLAYALNRGSPPHVRGPLGNHRAAFISCGITPACAGTTSKPPDVFPHTWDHPRMCGDHSVLQSSTVYPLGSPPHVRGPQLVFEGVKTEEGITPACAGTTKNLSMSPKTTWDHPRMCGDHGHLSRLRQHLQGSPPHVRGPHGGHSLIVADLGITPACAGTTR